jgi:hypothetical protein
MGRNIDITVISLPGGGGGGAPTDATYVVISGDPTLTNERFLAAGSGIAITDGGANSNVTIATTGGGGGGLTEAEVYARVAYGM